MSIVYGHLLGQLQPSNFFIFSLADVTVIWYTIYRFRPKGELNSVGRVPPCQGGCRGFESLSSLHLAEKVNGGVAQLVEQVTLNHWVQGSNPCAPTIQHDDVAR